MLRRKYVDVSFNINDKLFYSRNRDLMHFHKWCLRNQILNDHYILKVTDVSVKYLFIRIQEYIL